MILHRQAIFTTTKNGNETIDYFAVLFTALLFSIEEPNATTEIVSSFLA